MWELEIPGRPTSKGNSRRILKTRSGRVFTASSEATKKAENSARAFAAAHAPAETMAGPLIVDVQFRFKIPKSKQATRTRPAKVNPGDPRPAKPDRGNTLKLIEDALEGIVYDDDASICGGEVSKVWWTHDATWIRVRPWGTPAPDELRVVFELPEKEGES